MSEPASYYDAAIAWTWRFDTDFVQSIKEVAEQASLRILDVNKESVAEVLELVRKRLIRFRVFLDRASDEDDTFLPLMRLLQKRQHEQEDPVTATHIINAPDLTAKASDKATMHLEFLTNNVNVPYTIIISPYNHRKEIELTLSELAELGRPFIIKPANTTGGGIGVVTGAETLKDVLEARQHHRNDKYLLQETIVPTIIGSHRAWFRVFYAFGLVLPCWWDDRTHEYDVLSLQDEESFGLRELRAMTETIHSVCHLDFFSTEIALTADRRLVAVDYVNEMCDMRLQSKHPDGVPDGIVEQIVRRIIQFVKETA
jgi:hypothetical protein